MMFVQVGFVRFQLYAHTVFHILFVCVNVHLLSGDYVCITP